MSRLTSVIMAGGLYAGLLAGCGKSASNSGKSSADATNVSTMPASQTETPKAEGPKEHEKICFACNGSGTIKCLAPGCQDGMVDCPGPCLKLTRGTWIHADVPGHPPTDVWQRFKQSDGSYELYNQGHVGHVIAMENGKAVDTGPCKICGGSGKVPCSICKGTGHQTCLICDGKKSIPDSWTPTDNPWLNRQPDLIRLTDGRLLFGKVMSTAGTNAIIKTRDGKWVHVGAADIVPRPEGSPTNILAP